MPERPRHSDAAPFAAERKERVRQMVETGFQSLVEELKQGQSEHFLQYLDFCARFHRYSPYNQLLIFLQKPEATFVAGYRRWQELGQQVKRGEKGIEILAPVTYKRKDDEEEEEGRLAGFKVVHVFDASQLVVSKEKPLPTFWRQLPDDQEETFAMVKGAVEACGIEVQEAPLRRGRQGVSQGGRIILEEGADSRNRTMTLVHEWAHEIMHRSWMESEEWKNLPARVRECQAEAVSYIISRYLGIENPFARDYVLSYGNTAETLVANLGQVQAASHWMIETMARVQRRNEM